MSEWRDRQRKAAALRAEADRLEADAFDQRPLPDFWRVGQKVRYLYDKDFAWSAGETATILELDKQGVPAKEYQVFWTGHPKHPEYGRFWTTPDEVELIKDVAPVAQRAGA
jgi:hypothetical protein